MSKPRSVAATSEGIAKIKATMAQREKKEGQPGKNFWTQEYLATQAGVSIDTVKQCK